MSVGVKTTYFVLKTTRISLATLTVICLALSRQIEEQIAPAHGLALSVAVAVDNESRVPAGASSIAVVDQCDDPGALGYHVDQGGFASGIAGVGTVLDNGGTEITGANSASVTCSHELAELLLDPACNRWRENPDGHLQIEEIGDPVENDEGNVITVTGADGKSWSVTVSNFVFPAYFDASNTAGPFDQLGTLKAAFTISPGGYASVMTETSNVKQITARYGGDGATIIHAGTGRVRGRVIFGAAYPGWKRPMKLRYGRACMALHKRARHLL